MGYWNNNQVSELLGRTLSDIKVNKDRDEITFVCQDGAEYLMYHDQDCCESVTIDDISGDLINLVGSPITLAEESSNRGDDNDWGSSTWTFYKFGTVKGYVDIKWYGSSNGYYSESVDFKLISKDN